MNDGLSMNIKNRRRLYAFSLVGDLLDEQVPFNLILWNNDNWDSPLPDKILEDNPDKILLIIDNDTLKESFSQDGIIILETEFGGKIYTKELSQEEIIAIIDMEGKYMIFNGFDQNIEEETLISKEGLINLITSRGISRENALNSLESFMKSNPDLVNRYK